MFETNRKRSKLTSSCSSSFSLSSRSSSSFRPSFIRLSQLYGELTISNSHYSFANFYMTQFNYQGKFFQYLTFWMNICHASKRASRQSFAILWEANVSILSCVQANMQVAAPLKRFNFGKYLSSTRKTTPLIKLPQFREIICPMFICIVQMGFCSPVVALQCPASLYHLW